MPLKFNPTTGKLDLVNTANGGGIDPDTEENLLSSTPDGSGYVIATDTLRGLYYDADNTQWYVASPKLSTQPNAMDAGAYQSDPQGYYLDAINEKYIYNSVLRGSDREEEGSIRIDTSVSPTEFQIYLRSRWNVIGYDIALNSDNELIHTPYNWEIDIRSGNSTELSLSGYPVIQEYKTSAGAYQPPVIISGGSL